MKTFLTPFATKEVPYCHRKYGLDTNQEIIKINRQRWEIEENFRIMKTEFEARPVYVRRDDRIKAHFMTCYISLLLYRLLEQKIGNNYTTEQIIETFTFYEKMTLLNTANGCVPSYIRTEITDSLHKTLVFGQTMNSSKNLRCEASSGK